MAFHSKVLITGSAGFTGIYLSELLKADGYSVKGLRSNLLDSYLLENEVSEYCPDYVVHLAGISNTVHGSADELYKTNVIGSLNLLDALRKHAKHVNRVVVASSAAVYGNVYSGALGEGLCPRPVSHYGCSKLSMEHMLNAFRSDFNIVVTRPFNYTGVGHDVRFLVPKLVEAYKAKIPEIRLGNIDVAREFNDIRDVSEIYKTILESQSSVEVVNICSGRAVYLKDVIGELDRLSGYRMNVLTDDNLIRSNEIPILYGDCSVLDSGFKVSWKHDVKDTLSWMYSEPCKMGDAC